MTEIQLLRPEGLFASPAFSQVAVVPPGATMVYVGGQNAIDQNGKLVRSQGRPLAGQLRGHPLLSRMVPVARPCLQWARGPGPLAARLLAASCLLLVIAVRRVAACA